MAKDSKSDIEARLQAVEEWIQEFERGCEEAEAELAELLGNDTTIEFIAGPAIFRDKAKDN